VRRRPTTIAALVALALVFAAGSFAPPKAQAQEEKDEKKEGRKPPTKPGQSIDERTGKRLTAALDLMNAEKYDAARAELSELSMSSLSPFERAQVERILASIDHSQGKYASARSHLDKAMAEKALSDEDQLSIQFQIAQLLLAEEKWGQAVEALKAWFAKAPEPNSTAYYLLAIAYFQMENYGAALEPAQKAVDLTPNPQESWLQLVLALRLQREEYRAALPLLRQLLALYPNRKTYWIQLSSVQAALNDYGNALTALQLAYNQGLLGDQSDLRRLAELLLFREIPYRGGEILSTALEQKKVPGDAKTYETLGNCWVAAREFDRAIGDLTKAAEMSGSGDLYLRAGEIYVQREDWPKASKALGQALGKRGLKNPGQATLLLGISYYNQDNLEQAKKYFGQAMAHENVRSQAESWSRHVDQKTEALEDEEQQKQEQAAPAVPAASKDEGTKAPPESPDASGAGEKSTAGTVEG